MAPEARDDEAIRTQLLAFLEREPWADTHSLSIVVDHGVVHLWGLVGSESERQALGVAAENVAGVKGVHNHLRLSRDLPLLA